MARTTVGTREIRDGGVSKEDINTTTISKSLITDVQAGDNIEITSTGADVGTGSVTVSLSENLLLFNRRVIPEEINVKAGKVIALYSPILSQCLTVDGEVFIE